MLEFGRAEGGAPRRFPSGRFGRGRFGRGRFDLVRHRR
jgi:hypothetical protein